MSDSILILGDTGSGKTRSIRGLDPKETALISVIGKSLPWRGGNKQYTKYNPDTKLGNLWETRNTNSILKIFDKISTDLKLIHFKNIVIDDFQYILSFEYMERAKEGGWDRFNDIGQSAYFLFTRAKILRDDLTVFFLAHIEEGIDAYGNTKTRIKTVGEKFCLYLSNCWNILKLVQLQHN